MKIKELLELQKIDENQRADLLLKKKAEEALEEERKSLDKDRNDIFESTDEDLGTFLASKRIKSILSETEDDDIYSGIKKASIFLSLYEDKVLDEEAISIKRASLIVNDSMRALKESINKINNIKIKKAKTFDTAPLAKMISSVMFEVQTIGEEFSLEVTDAKIEDKDLERKVKQDFMLIANSVL